MNSVPTRSLVSRMFRGITIAHIVAFVISLSMLLVGVFILSNQWTAMQAQIIANTEKVAALQAIVSTNEQRIHNQHIRLSALETYNKELVESMKSLAIDSKKMVELLSAHVYPRAAPDGSIEVNPNRSGK